MTETDRLTDKDLDQALKRNDVFLLDVREPDEIEEHGTVDGYTNIPLAALEDRLSELPRDRPILTA